MRVGALLFCGVVFLVAADIAAAAEEIRVPFGFTWGESQQRLEKMLEQAQAKVVDRREVDGQQVLTVTGIAQRLLLRAVFYFENDALSEIELHYGDPSWDAARYAAYFNQTRRHLDKRYGGGKLITRSREKRGETLHTMQGYQWSQPSATLQMFLFTAERGAQSHRVLSLHYRGF